VKWFNDLRLANKLLVAFGVILLDVLALGAFAVSRLELVDGQSRNITDNALPGIVTLAAVGNNMSELRVNVVGYVNSDTSAEAAPYLKDMQSAKTALAVEMGSYGKGLGPRAEDRQLWDAFISKWRDYLSLGGEVTMLFESGRHADAKKTLNERRGVFGDARDALGQVIAWNAGRATELSSQSRQVVTSSGRLIFALLAVSILLGAAITVFIARALGGPVAAAIDTLRKISAGKLDNVIETGRRDEIGKLLHGLADMQLQLQGRIEGERAAAAATGRIKSALDQASARVMVTNSANEITYVNDACLRLFRDREQEVRGVITTFDAGSLVGSSIETLHRSPADRRATSGAQPDAPATLVEFGAFKAQVEMSAIRDEQGNPCGALFEWLDRTQELQIEAEVNAVVEGALEGNLGRRVGTAGKTGFHQLIAAGLNRLLENMSEVIDSIRVAALEVQRGADEISAGNADLSQRTEQQSASLEETASSMEEMTSTVKQNADNAVEADKLALAARSRAEAGGSLVSTAVSAMTQINESSNKIADIIGVIDAIAFQTNLLALNAAVEAARAGEQGRGFAVVATEVRNLAGRSATAAKEIKALIQDSVRKVEHGSLLVSQSGTTLGEIVRSVKKVSDIVAEIAAASREQSSGIEQVNRAVTQMDETTQHNAALVEESTAASQSLADQARTLNQIMLRFQMEHGAAGTKAATVERRGERRPWTRAVGSAQPAVAAAGNDSKWQEF
jgi:methyl-accepting chemotaxis protein